MTAAPRDKESSYADLLTMLRRDLLLDATVDLLPGSLTRALFTDGSLAAVAGTRQSSVKAAFGLGVLTFSGGATASVSVAHDLGADPLVAYACQNGSGSAHAMVFAVISHTDAALLVAAELISGTYTGAMPFAWLAIG